MAVRPQDLSESEVDRVLLEGAAKRDREALGALYERYGESLYHYLACAGASAEDAQSALYSVFAAIWQNPRPCLKLDPFRPHIFGQTYRALAAAQNAKSSAPQFRNPIGLDAPDGIAEALNALDPFARHITILNEVCRLGYREIADALGEPSERIAELKAGASAALVQSLNGPAAEAPESAKDIASYADGELSPDDGDAIEARLNGGGPEADYYADLMRTRDALRRISPARPPRSLWERIELTLRKRELRQRSSAARLTIELVLLVLAALAGAAGWIASNPDWLETVRRRLPARLGGLEGLSPLPLDRKGQSAAWVCLPVGDAVLTSPAAGRQYAFPAGGRILCGEAVEVRAGGPASIILPDGGQVLAAAGARFRFESPESDGALVLEQGDFACSVFSEDKPFEVRTPNTSLSTRGGDFSVNVSPIGENGQPVKQVQTAGAPNPPAAVAAARSILTRAIVAYGEIESQGQSAVTGETMTIAGEQEPKSADTPFGEPALAWAAEARKSAVFEAVEAFTRLRRQFGALVASKNQDAVFKAATDGDVAPFFKPFIQAERYSAEPWYVQQLQDFLQAVPNLQVLSARRAGQRVILRVGIAGRPSASARIVMEKREKPKDETKEAPEETLEPPALGPAQEQVDWKIAQALGWLARPTPPGSDSRPASASAPAAE